MDEQDALLATPQASDADLARVTRPRAPMIRSAAVFVPRRTRNEIGVSKIRARLHYFAPRDAGALVDVSGAAVMKSSKRAKEAQQFVAYLVSKPAQEIIAKSQSYEYPLGSGVQTKRDIKPFSELKPPDISVNDLGDGRGALRALEQVGLL